MDETKPPPGKPTLTIEEDGSILLNAAAFSALHEPLTCGLLYNKEKQIFGLCDGKGFRVRRITGGWCIAGGLFFRAMRLRVTMTFTYQADPGPEVDSGKAGLFVDISDLVDESKAFQELFLASAPTASEEVIS